MKNYLLAIGLLAFTCFSSCTNSTKDKEVAHADLAATADSKAMEK